MAEPWPTFHLVGAEKAATTSLYRYLRQHPDVFLPERKEPGFFTLEWDRAEAEPGFVEHWWGEDKPDDVDLDERRQWYLSLYEEAAPDQERGDCTASYLWHPRAADRIHDATPEARILVLVRDPVERAYSHYLMACRANAEDRGFLEALEDEPRREDGQARPKRYLLSGRYSEHIDRYTQRFGEDAVHVAFTERMSEQPHAVLRDVCEHLDVSTEPVADLETGQRHHAHKQPPNRLAEWLRSAQAPKKIARRLLPKPIREVLGNELLLAETDKPTMPDEAREFLVSYYEDEAGELAQRIGREPPWPWT